MPTPDKPKRANLRDVARLAQVSVATVSRVLNRSDLVTKATRDRVNQAIKALVDRFRTPTLITSYFDKGARYPTIGYDNGAIAANAFGYLQSLGHRSIAVIHGPTADNDRTTARIDAIKFLEGQGICRLWQVEIGVAGCASGVRAMTEHGAPPSAILCLSDVQALGASFEGAPARVNYRILNCARMAASWSRDRYSG